MVRYRQATLLCIVWPPAFYLAGEIVAELSKSGKIGSLITATFEPQDLLLFIRKVYELDKATKRKIEPKIDRLSESYTLMVFEITLTQPRIVPHSDDNSWKRSETINLLKHNIRRQFSSRIKDYVYDVVIHSVEFPEQNAAVIQLVKKYAVSYSAG